jgi:hypothetical protein
MALKRNELSSKEKEIFNYLRAKDGVIKQKVVNDFAHKYSRKTVFKILRGLKEDHKMIVVRPDNSNSRVHHVYVNKENLLASTIIDLDDFKDALFVLLDKAKGIQKKLGSEAKRNNGDYSIERKIYELEYIISSSIFDIYKYFFDTYILHSLFKWPEATKDKEILNKLNTTFFVNMQEIQSKISEAMSIVVRPSHREKEFIRLMNSRLSISGFEDMLSTFQFIGLRKEFEPIMDRLWKTSFDYIDFERKRKRDSKDWRNALQGNKARFASPVLGLVAEHLLRR